MKASPSEAVAIRDLLSSNGMEVSHQSRTDAFLEMLHRDSFDVLLIDCESPTMSSYEMLRHLRKDLRLSVPVIVMVALGSEFDAVSALEAGADDYLVKPWRPLELVARLSVLLRPGVDRAGKSAIETWAGWEFDSLDRRVSHGNVSVKLSRKEFEVARALFRYLGQDLSREHLSLTIWGHATPSRSLDTHISRIRSRLNLTAANGCHLESIYGFGYRLEMNSPEPRDNSRIARKRPDACASAANFPVIS